MNYFAHGMRFLDRPYFLAGTALPDWLNVVDRRVRLRPRRVEPVANSANGAAQEIASGVLQHFYDDGWFHKSLAFLEISSELTRRFRQSLGNEPGYRASFLGHIVTELMLDGVLIDSNPSLLDAYYTVLDEIDTEEVQRTVNRMAKVETDQLAWFIGAFQREQFLRDYGDSDRMLYRLNQVLGRIKLKPLPDETTIVLESAREIVKAGADDLLIGWHGSLDGDALSSY